MEPTIKTGETVDVDFAAYRFNRPQRWDVVVFDAPDGKEGRWLSRVVALPGEVVEVTDAGLWIDGKPVVLPSHLSHVAHHPSRRAAGSRLTKYPFTVPADGCFVMGDNPDNSLDSRYWGALDCAKILGKVSGK